MFIDTHAHIYSDKFAADRSQMLQRAFQAGISTILMPNVDTESIDQMLELNRVYPQNCLPMFGLHPCSVDACFEQELQKIETYFAQYKACAVGEMGLDLYWDNTFFEQQKQAFRIQAQWAKERNLPLVIHSREAMPQTIELLEELKDDRLFGVLHCFSGNLEQAQSLIDLGFKLGIGGVLTYKKSGLDQVLSQIALEHLILETDCPYLAPLPHRGKRNEVAYMVLVAEKLAQIKNLSIEQVAQITTQNAQQLFALN